MLPFSIEMATNPFVHTVDSLGRHAPIISGFPGVGKSTLVNSLPYASDSDSSKHPKDGFPANYINHIKTLIGKWQPILISSHQEVRDALAAEFIPCTIVVPAQHLKYAYLERYKGRGSPEAFINLMDAQWDNFVNSCLLDTRFNRVILNSPDVNLADAYTQIKQNFPEFFYGK